ncbi:MAG: carbamoyl phosphate synthase large subunit, partial [Ruminiclostridium sp.]|nr:carbamoyl phosphate synthase large subunit [Ruminiclostridium sp.]
SKVCNVSMARIATEIIMAANTGKKSSIASLAAGKIPHFGVKEAVFPFNMFQEVDPILGPEMRSTGEVLGIADSFGLAYYKAQDATKSPLPISGTVLISVNDQDKSAVLEVAREFKKIGFKILATGGTHRFLLENGIQSEEIKKMYEGRPNIVDGITNKEINLVINTPSGKRSQHDDSYIRKTAIKYKIPYITTITAALASAKGIAAYKENSLHEARLKSLQEYHSDIK